MIFLMDRISHISFCYIVIDMKKADVLNMGHLPILHCNLFLIIGA